MMKALFVHPRYKSIDRKNYDFLCLDGLKNQLTDTISYILQDNDMVIEGDIQKFTSKEAVYDFWNAEEFEIDEKGNPRIKFFNAPVGYEAAKCNT